MADDRSRGVHLTDKQLVFVFMAATVVAVVVFLCGVLVGRGVQAVRGPAGEAAMMTPPQVVADGVQADPPALPPATTPASPAGRGAGASANPADTAFTDRLGKTPPAEQLKAQSPQKPVPPESANEPPVPPENAEDAAGAPASDLSGTGDYTVQVAAVKKRSEADVIVKRLKAKGFDAYVFAPDGTDKLGVLRVRVGHFPTRGDADAMARRIEREDKSKPWVTRTR